MNNMTAKMSCFARAYHDREKPLRIFEDDVAEKILGEDYDQIARNMTAGIDFFLPGFQGSKEEGLRLIVNRQLAPSVLGRSVWCEKRFEQERALGCNQVLLFASGYDSFSVRNRDASLKIFELDRPDMLADKKLRLERAGLKTSALTVPCDLAQKGWQEKLIANGFSANQISFGSLLGLSYYLDKAAWRVLLSGISDIMAEGSAICFDYPVDIECLTGQINRALANEAGEEMKARYTYAEIEALLAERGFLIYEHLNDRDMTEQFFSKYNQANPNHPIQAPADVAYVLAVRK